MDSKYFLFFKGGNCGIEENLRDIPHPYEVHSHQIRLPSYLHGNRL
jgi:hypothetical protein